MKLNLPTCNQQNQHVNQQYKLIPPNVHFILRHECLAENWRILQRHISLPNLPDSKKKRSVPDWDFYDAESFGHIAQYYHGDIVRFGYFYKNIDHWKSLWREPEPTRWQRFKAKLKGVFHGQGK
jgi:hypothetical protein